VTYKLAAFGEYFADVLGGKPTSFAKYRSFLNRTDQLAGGLDEMIESKGIDGTRTWARNQIEPPFDKFTSDARSIVNSYLGFVHTKGELSSTLDADSTSAAETPLTGIFKIEKEMQAAVRKDLNSLENGLLAIDDGIEVTTATGRIDILARDANGQLTVIELKAGQCPPGAIEQSLGYAQAISEERSEEARVILIASSFTDRQLYAAKRAHGLILRVYHYQLHYSEA
jgi:hypothetical protein